MGSSGGVLTDLTTAVIRASVKTLNGQVASTPALTIGDGKNQLYACDVNVGIMSANGRIDQSVKDLYGIPGRRGYTANSSLTVGTILRNVPLAPNNGSLRYAQVGNAVTVTRTTSGQWQVSGFSVELPGTRVRYAVNLTTLTLGPVQDLTVNAQLLTLEQLSQYGGGFGVCPFGASGIFVSGVLEELVI
jgi:hypothetical protein